MLQLWSQPLFNNIDNLKFIDFVIVSQFTIVIGIETYIQQILH